LQNPTVLEKPGRLYFPNQPIIQKTATNIMSSDVSLPSQFVSKFIIPQKPFEKKDEEINPVILKNTKSYLQPSNKGSGNEKKNEENIIQKNEKGLMGNLLNWVNTLKQ